MRTLFIAALLAVGLSACSDPETPIAEPDTTVIAGPADNPEIPLAAQVLVGRWMNQNGNYLEFRGDGTVSVTGRDQLDMAFRVLGDSLVVADSSAILAVETIPPENRYYIETLTTSDLVLEPAGNQLGGAYTREGEPSDTTGME